MNTKLIGLVSVSDTITITIINKTTNQIASINHYPDSKDLASKIYSNFQGISLEEIYMGFDTQTTTKFGSNAYSMGTFSVGTITKHSIISIEDLAITQQIAQKLCVKTVKIFDYVSLFKVLSNDKETIFLENSKEGIRAVHVDRGEIKDYRVGVTPESIKTSVKLSKAQVNKLFDINYTRKYGIGFINFDMLPDEYKIALIPVLFMMYNPPCLEINPYGSLPVSNAYIQNQSAQPQPVQQPVQQPVEQQYRKPVEQPYTPPKVAQPPIEMPKEKPAVTSNVITPNPMDEMANKKTNFIGNLVGVVAGAIIGVSIATTTQLPKQNLILMDTLQTMASTSTDIDATTQYYNRLIEGISNPERSNSSILAKISAITNGGTIAEISLKKNNVEVLVLVENETNLETFKNELANIVSIGQMTNVGSVTLGETTLTKYKIYCTIE